MGPGRRKPSKRNGLAWALSESPWSHSSATMYSLKLDTGATGGQSARTHPWPGTLTDATSAPQRRHRLRGSAGWGTGRSSPTRELLALVGLGVVVGEALSGALTPRTGQRLGLPSQAGDDPPAAAAGGARRRGGLLLGGGIGVSSHGATSLAPEGTPANDDTGEAQPR